MNMKNNSSLEPVAALTLSIPLYETQPAELKLAHRTGHMITALYKENKLYTGVMLYTAGKSGPTIPSRCFTKFLI